MDALPIKFPVIALVASAGGLNALTRVLTPLPADLSAAILIVQHISPERPSSLAHILGQRTALPVHTAGDGDSLAAGTVLIAPAAHHLLVTSEARIGLIESGEFPPARPSADLLLVTLAVTCGPRALAVVLTGTGTDAQAGIRAIRHCGGTVFAQDQISAAYFGMPSAAIDTGVVHAVLPLDQIANAIQAHVDALTGHKA
ncbi:chemotaxis protein CheB [Mycobacterium sp. 852002-40037_SCH5390672]|uniref:chemotaxis protein CheB n=1 Tax=Mycobacterium sp. 852002-40037_SCH5390672 TaxID=1834089 RepID=UPI000804E666|nr:chemotaxis protein CheB [Mycobacterium sp. 852002-40037_SCH5390672]OBB96482.1 chemotaxis protein CheB [Mycobacterium sp. 852002-40037_SCH5390672]